MTYELYKGPVPEITRRRSAILLLSSSEKELFQGTKNCRETGYLDKEAGHMYTTFSNILSSPPIRPMVESTQLLVRTQLNTRWRTEECA